MCWCIVCLSASVMVKNSSVFQLVIGLFCASCVGNLRPGGWGEPRHSVQAGERRNAGWGIPCVQPLAIQHHLTFHLKQLVESTMLIHTSDTNHLTGVNKEFMQDLLDYKMQTKSYFKASKNVQCFVFKTCSQTTSHNLFMNAMACSFWSILTYSADFFYDIHAALSDKCNLKLFCALNKQIY